MKNQCCEESVPARSPSQLTSECWFDDACILDMDYFVKTLSGIKQKGVRADLVGSIITHYASKWLPDLSSSGENGLTQFEESPESVTTSWMKKRFFVETLVGVLPPEKDSIPCNFLLRLLRTANMVGVEATYRAELEKRISWQLDQASLKELMIPSFSHTCGTLLDVELVIRLVKRFVSLDHEGAKTGAALVKVAKLVDCYLAEAAVDANLSLSELVALAGALPSHARATDDGLYRAIDTYLKTMRKATMGRVILDILENVSCVVTSMRFSGTSRSGKLKGEKRAHPSVSKQERKGLCRLIDSRKLTPEASLHAAQNERLPVRAVIQVLFSEQTKLNRYMDWSGSFSGLRSPNGGFDPPTRMAEKKKGFFKWRKLGMTVFNKSVGEVENMEEAEREVGFGRQTPMEIKTSSLVKGRTPHKWRKSMS
ncbi:NPH3 domain [Sesbania bispinosa]|nr:NPH3 domain [Sesbania bispinosa]